MCFCFKQKTADEMRISDWSSDVCSSDLADDQARVDELDADAEAATQSVEGYIEEHAVEDGLLAEAMHDDKISKALVTARLRTAKRESVPDADEIQALDRMRVE